MMRDAGLLTPWAAIITEAGWYSIGDPADQSPLRRWPHDRWVEAFGVRRDRPLAVTMGDMRELLSGDRYLRAMKRDVSGGFRDQNTLISAVAAGFPHQADLPFPLTFAEARLAALLLGGRMPLEEEVEILARRVPVNGLPAPLWTASPWSAWSYRLTAYDGVAGRWRALRERSLPDLLSAPDRVSMFGQGPPLRRIRSGFITQGPVGRGNDSLSEDAEGGGGPMGILWLVTSL